MFIFFFRAPTLLPLKTLPLNVKFHAINVRARERHKEAVLTPFLHEMTRPSVPSLWYPSLEVSNRKHKRQTSNILKQAYIDKTLTTTKFILDHIQISDTVVSVKGLNPGVSCIYRTS